MFNVDDAWFSDPRRQVLSKLFQSEYMADGCAIALWRLAREYVRRKNIPLGQNGLIPMAIFELFEGREFVLKARLAEERLDGVYVRGTSTHFSYLEELHRRAKQGGLAGAARLRDAHGHYVSGAKTAPSGSQAESKQNPSESQAETKRNPSETQANSSPLSLSLSLALEELNPKKEVSHFRESKPIRPHPLVELWNEHRGPLAKVTRVSPARLKKITARYPDLSPDDWADVVARVARSKFLTGGNDRGWRATLDWLVKPDRAIQVLEGNYDQAQNKNSESNFDADVLRIFGEDVSDD